MYKKRHIVECKADMKQVSIDHVFLLASINLAMVDKGLVAFVNAQSGNVVLLVPNTGKQDANRSPIKTNIQN